MSTRNLTAAAIVVGLMMVLPAQAEYVSIQANMINGLPDTDYAGGVLTIDSTGATNQLDLNDPTPLGGAITSFDLDLTTTYHHSFWDGDLLKAAFSGGYFSLHFDYDGSPHYIEGSIDGMIFYVSSSAPPRLHQRRRSLRRYL